MLKIFTSLMLTALASSTFLSAQQLEMRFENERTLEITGGVPNSRCGVVVGLDEQAIELPGGATLQLEPIMLAEIGRFDANGKLIVDLGISPVGGAPVNFLAQAISMDDTGEFRCSTLKFVHYDGDQHFHLSEDPPAKGGGKDNVVTSDSDGDRDEVQTATKS